MTRIRTQKSDFFQRGISKNTENIIGNKYYKGSRLYSFSLEKKMQIAVVVYFSAHNAVRVDTHRIFVYTNF